MAQTIPAARLRTLMPADVPTPLRSRPVTAPRPAAALTPAPVTGPANLSAAGTAPLWAALCEGAGLSPLPPEPGAETMRQIGQWLRLSLHSAQQRWQQRAAAGATGGLDAPEPAAADDGAALLARWLSGAAPLSAAAVQALAEALAADAVPGPLDWPDALSPAVLEARLGPPGWLDRWWPQRRAARLWRLYRHLMASGLAG